MEHDPSIELRSEKVRSIIGQMPPAIIRIGTGAMFIAIALLLTGLYFFEYEKNIEVPAVIETTDSKVILTVMVPAACINQIEPGQIAIPNLNSFANSTEIYLPMKITSISDTLIIDKNNNAFYKCTAKPEKQNINLQLQEPKTIEATIQTGKTTLINDLTNHNP